MAIAILTCSGCGNIAVQPRGPNDSAPVRPRAVVVLLDCTASFASFDAAKRKIATELVPALHGGDHFYAVRIRNFGFRDCDLVINESVPASSHTIQVEAAAAKRRICDEVSALKPVREERGTDIVGAIYHAADILAQHDRAERWLFIYSDMEQDTERALLLHLPTGTHVACLYVSHTDGSVSRYEAKRRLWQQRLQDAGAESVSILDVAGTKSSPLFR